VRSFSVPYQERDWEIVDYQLYELPGTGLSFRGPNPGDLRESEYFVCLGAAQTFGCFATRPFPVLLQERLGMPVLNLGYAGAGPEFFFGNGALMAYINRARFAVVQVMSGRSESNSLFDSGGLELLTRRSDGARIGADAAYRELLEDGGEAVVRRVVEETRANWVASCRRLLGDIKVPTLLFWFSKRSPSYGIGYDNLFSMFSSFPQLVDDRMVAQVRPLADDYVECVTQRGIPQRLISRFTGEPVVLSPPRKDLSKEGQTHNLYYPSPEMHEDAADCLGDACSRLAVL
jgi:hypothetical protein